jgi:glutathione peroxidase
MLTTLAQERRRRCTLRRSRMTRRFRGSPAAFESPIPNPGLSMTTVHDFSATTIDGIEQPLCAWRGKTLLIVNVASKCGFTPQYAGLEKLYETWRERGLVVLGFPCDQFGHQEPGDEAAIKQFCSLNYGVTFPLFAKIEVNGANAHPLYQYLKRAAKGVLGSESIKWNFTKFLVDKDGAVVRRYAPTDTPERIGNDLAAML